MSMEGTTDDLEDGGSGGEVCGGGWGGASASGEGGQPRGRVGGEEGEASVDVESLFEAKDVLQKIPKSLVWNFMRYVITIMYNLMHWP